jgi:hypothetical protein
MLTNKEIENSIEKDLKQQKADMHEPILIYLILKSII